MWETCWQVTRELQMKDQVQVEEEEPAMCET
jgi:hypothetical protein